MIREFHTSLDGENDISHRSTLLHRVTKLRLCFCFENVASGGEKNNTDCTFISAQNILHWVSLPTSCGKKNEKMSCILCHCCFNLLKSIVIK